MSQTLYPALPVTIVIVMLRTVTAPDNPSANDTPTPKRSVVIHHGRRSRYPR